MARRTTESGIHVIRTGHTMSIDPAVCSNCHGNTHLLTVQESRRTTEEISEVKQLESDKVELEETATQNLYSGVVGGAIGVLILLGLIYIVVRLGRLR
jgi:hypothetical protein